MISIYNTDNKEIRYCTENIIIKHKDAGDVCLVAMHSELSKSLINYKLFIYLQDLNNAYFNLLEKLYYHKYTYFSEAIKDKKEFNNVLNIFLRHCEDELALYIYSVIKTQCNKLSKNIANLFLILNEIND